MPPCVRCSSTPRVLPAHVRQLYVAVRSSIAIFTTAAADLQTALLFFLQCCDQAFILKAGIFRSRPLLFAAKAACQSFCLDTVCQGVKVLSPANIFASYYHSIADNGCAEQ